MIESGKYHKEFPQRNRNLKELYPKKIGAKSQNRKSSFKTPSNQFQRSLMLFLAAFERVWNKTSWEVSKYNEGGFDSAEAKLNFRHHSSPKSGYMQSRWRRQKKFLKSSPCSTLWHAKSSFVILWPDILKTNAKCAL